METPRIYNWLQQDSHTQTGIKLEPSVLNSTSSLLFALSNCSTPTKSVLKSASDLKRSRRVKPYSTQTRKLRKNTGEMPNKSYTWSSPTTKDGKSQFHAEPTSNRRASVDDRQAESSYTISDAFTTQSIGCRSSDRIGPRPQSSGSNMATSSLTGAMGNAHISSQPTAPICQTNAPYMQGVAWTTSQHRASPAQTPYTGIQEQSGNMPYHNLSSSTAPSTTSYAQYQGYNHSSYHDTSPGSPPRSTSFPSSTYGNQFEYHPTRPLSAMRTPAVSSSPPEPYGTSATLPHHIPPNLRPNSFSSAEQYENEIFRLHKKIRELETINESLRHHQKDPAVEVAGIPGPSYSQGSDAHVGVSHMSIPPSQSAAFQAAWKARTDARVRQFCSLNRAGNALCAWHDSRRERRAYPPRMAPSGHLNCGCTYEEALFEESLSRHGVGSYHPGESVRMDPALRNPLLQLLQARYGYRDGDFERDTNTGLWIEGEGPEMWDQNSNVRKK